MEPGRSRQGRHRKNSGRLALTAMGMLLNVHCLPAAAPKTQTVVGESPASGPQRETVNNQGPASSAARPSTARDHSAPTSQKQPLMDELKRRAQEAIQQSRRYLYAAVLPVREELQRLAEDENAAPSELAPIEQFFIYSVSPAAATKADPHEVAKSYCAALRAVRGDWWSLPGPASTQSGQELVALGRHVVPCLVDLLGDQTPLHYLNGEAQTMTNNYSFVVADLAAGFLAEILKKPFDHEERSVKRRQAAYQRLRVAAGR